MCAHEIDRDQAEYALLWRCLEVAARDARRTREPELQQEAAAFLWDFSPEFAERERVPQVTEHAVPEPGHDYA